MDHSNQEPLVLTVAEVARYLKISRGMAYQLVKRGALKSKAFGRARRVLMKSLLEFLDSGD